MRCWQGGWPCLSMLSLWTVAVDLAGMPPWVLVPGGPGSMCGELRSRTVGCALAGGALAMELHFGPSSPGLYLVFTAVLPLLWWATLAIAGGYESRFIGVGSDEFRRVLNAGLGLTGDVAILCYAFKYDLARSYVAIALPAATVLDLMARYRLRKGLHGQRSTGACMQRVVAVGHAPAVADLVAELRRDSYHGLSVVGACLAGGTMLNEIAGVPGRRWPGHGH